MGSSRRERTGKEMEEEEWNKTAEMLHSWEQATCVGLRGRA
jgi:hypothetical protein